ncbi:MAG TPA: hypothetical protein VH186_11400 [Chloroflexia bacterium]|nr:hypothetical protein [Chloroflexia bacterium]
METSATLTISDAKNETEDGFIEGPPTFIVSASQGNFAVSLLLDEANFYDLAGNPMATGVISFKIGGQETPFPRKYLVDLEQVLEVSRDYLRIGEAILLKYSWDNQQDHDNAWFKENIVT